METKGKLIILEAGDASGKETQTRLLYERLSAEGRDVTRVSFPDYESDSSALVKMYLRGDFGAEAADVDAYAASAFFAVDRYASFHTKWGEAYSPVSSSLVRMLCMRRSRSVLRSAHSRSSS